MSINFNHIKAFEPMHTDLAKVTGKRYEDGITRDLSLTCKCCVLIGEMRDGSDRTPAAPAVHDVSIEVMKSNWPDHTDPQKGDVFDVQGYGEMAVRRRPFDNGTSYKIEATYKKA